MKDKDVKNMNEKEKTCLDEENLWMKNLKMKGGPLHEEYF